ncbi:MAG: class I SAM-dependent methyltransferase [Bacteroidota bacterium]
MSITFTSSDYTDPNYIGAKFRRKRFEFFEEKIKNLPRPIKILDIGGKVIFWKNVNYHDNKDFDITVLNLDVSEEGCSNIHIVSGNACDLNDYKDNEFDLAHSNSVIEHLFNKENQIKMANEVMRVSRKYFVQTPNLYFPIEPHFKFPLFQFLPNDMKVFLQTQTKLIKGETCTKAYAEYIIKEIQLLSEGDMRALFPNAKIYKEKFMGLTKSFIAHNF